MATARKEEVEQDALVMVALRNEFYRKKFHFLMGVYVLSLLVIIVLLSTAVYLFRNPIHPYYFMADKIGRLLPIVSLQTPNMTKDEVMAWTIDAVQQANSYDYMNYRAQLQDSQKYFTEYGWRNYMDSLRASNNLVALTQRKMVVVTKVTGPIKTVVEGVLGNSYAWKFEIPMLATYYMPPYDDKSKFQNPLVVTVIVQRQKLLESYKGLGIVQMIANLVLTPTSQSLTETPG